MKDHRIVRSIYAVAATLTLAGTLNAGVPVTASTGKEPVDKTPVPAPKEESLCDKIFGIFSLYKNDSNPFIEELSITGRYHGQFWAADGDGSDNDWDNRRFRLGLNAVMFGKHLQLKGEMFSDLNSGGDFYAGFTELFAAIKPNADDSLVFTIGKQKPRFGWEWSLSSRFISTFERSALINQFRPDYAPGVTVSGKQGNLQYYAGVFSDQVDKEFGDFDGGWSAIASVGYDFKESWGFDKAVLRFDFIHSDIDSNDTIFTAFDNGVSTSLELKKGKLGFVTEALAGFGDADNVSLIFIPTYDITKKIQIVGRYQFGISSEDHGYAAQRRYEREVGGVSGDMYNAAYLGLNYFICEHKLKLMTGVEYSNMSGGEDVLTYFAGIRAYW